MYLENNRLTCVKTQTVRTASDGEEDDGSNSDIDRQGVNADEARAHFFGATVDARDVNFSDSIAAKRKSYKSKNRRRQRRDDGSEEVGDLSDGEDESLERKMARLRREVEELKVEMANREESKDVENKEIPTEGQETLGDGVQELSRALDNVYASSRSATGHSAAAALFKRLASHSDPDSSTPQPTDKDRAKASTEPSPGVLSQAAAFDSRLALIEAAMGISSSSNPFVPDGNSELALQPVLPAVEHLTSRLSTLTNLLVGPTPASAVPTMGIAPPTTTISTPNLEALSARVRKLTADTEALATVRKRAFDTAKAAQTARIASATVEPNSDMSVSSSSAPPEVDPVANQRDEQATKIQALYATLPTIQSLHPLLPSVLERLRSLRAIHAGAAQAAESLDELERRQAEMKGEVEQWREGLKVVEEKMGQGEGAMKSNIGLVEPWVRDLETRLDRLEGSM